MTMNDFKKQVFVEGWQYLNPWAKLTLTVVILTWKMKRHFMDLLTFPARLIENVLKKGGPI